MTFGKSPSPYPVSEYDGYDLTQFNTLPDAVAITGDESARAVPYRSPNSED
jgi:hypothetical protein